MNWLQSFWILAHLIFPTGEPPHSQTLTYGIYRGDDEIGVIVASVKSGNDQVEYYVDSDATFRVIWKYNRTTDLDVVYSKDVLVSSTNQIFLNQKLKECAKVKMVDGSYRCTFDPDDSFVQEPEILFSTARLYFQEPVGIDEVYSEAYLEFAPLQDMGENIYELTLPGDRINHYVYENGQLMEIRVFRTWFNLTFKRK